MSQPACDGTGIVVLGSVTTPGQYSEGVQRLLDANPGASYLRTDQSCPSLRQATADGNPIYAVYRVAGRSQAAVCDAVAAAGAGAYGRWLNTTLPPDHKISC
jgi:serine/threonine-protein kinase